MSDLLPKELKAFAGMGGAADGGGASGDWAVANPIKKVNELVSKVSDSGKISEFTGPISNGLADNTIKNAMSQAAELDKSANTLAKSTSGLSPTNANAAGLPKEASTANFRVKIVSKINSSDFVEFVVSPTITEARSASYSATDLLHHPGQMQIYKSTGARSWNITGMFISRTAEEAQINLRMVNIIRSWTMPYYGTGTEASEKGAKEKEVKKGSRFGAPPDTLTLSAYGETMIGPVPTVLSNSNFNWPNDVQYIQTTSGNPFPVILNVTIDLIESYSSNEYSSFSLMDYKAGDLTKAFAGT